MTLFFGSKDSCKPPTIDFVEYLEFICRVALKIYPDDLGRGQSTPIEIQVYDLLGKIFDHTNQNIKKNQFPKLREQRKQTGAEDLELVPIDSDGDSSVELNIRELGV